MHFWLSTARLYGRVPVPRNTSLNWFIPALVNSSVGSSSGTTLDDGTAVWPCFCTKKSMNCCRISFAVSMRGSQKGKPATEPLHGVRRRAQVLQSLFYQSELQLVAL